MTFLSRRLSRPEICPPGSTGVITASTQFAPGPQPLQALQARQKGVAALLQPSSTPACCPPRSPRPWALPGPVVPPVRNLADGYPAHLVCHLHGLPPLPDCLHRPEPGGSAYPLGMRGYPARPYTANSPWPRSPPGPGWNRSSERTAPLQPWALGRGRLLSALSVSPRGLRLGARLLGYCRRVFCPFPHDHLMPGGLIRQDHRMGREGPCPSSRAARLPAPEPPRQALVAMRLPTRARAAAPHSTVGHRPGHGQIKASRRWGRGRRPPPWREGCARWAGPAPDHRVQKGIRLAGNPAAAPCPA